MPTLREAGHAADLPAILERLYPESGARAGKRGRVRCVWRGGRDESGNLFQDRDGKRKLYDFVTRQTLDAFDVMTTIGGKTRAQAAAELTDERAIARPGPAPRTAVPEVEALDFPDEVLANLLWSRLNGRALWPTDPAAMTEQGRRCLALLADWIVDSLKTAQ
jgi:putative DNA primase/helicase